MHKLAESHQKCNAVVQTMLHVCGNSTEPTLSCLRVGSHETNTLRNNLTMLHDLAQGTQLLSRETNKMQKSCATIAHDVHHHHPGVRVCVCTCVRMCVCAFVRVCVLCCDQLRSRASVSRKGHLLRQ